MYDWTKEGPVAACETVKNILKKKTHNIEKADQSLSVVNVHREPFTKSLAQSIHTWQEEQNKRVRREGEKFSLQM